MRQPDGFGGSEPGGEVSVGAAPGGGDLFELGPAGEGMSIEGVGDALLEYPKSRFVMSGYRGLG